MMKPGSSSALGEWEEGLYALEGGGHALQKGQGERLCFISFGEETEMQREEKAVQRLGFIISILLMKKLSTREVNQLPKVTQQFVGQVTCSHF